MGHQQVFISYAWGGESELVANELEAVLQSNQINLIRDKNNLAFKGLIREFMEQIGKGDFVVLIISDKYLKSKNCMFELMEVAKRGSFLDRIFPIVLSDAAIYEGLGILGYLKYWDQKLKDLNASAKELESLEKIQTIQNEINLFAEIRTAIDDLAGQLSNMNTLSIEIMKAKSYQPLLDALMKSGSNNKTSKPPAPSRKEGKVLYHIPAMMQVLSWTRCTVRLAWEEIILKEGLKIPEQEQVIESVRLGEIMQVSLSEGQGGGNFEIKSLNNEEQFIINDDFTEWLFDVKPLEAGDFTIILRVTLIQVIQGKERKKDIVLERKVKTATLVPKALSKFDTAESNLNPPLYPSELSETDESDMVDEDSDFSFERNKEASLPSYSSLPPASAAPKPAKRKSIYRKILPYAASLAGIVLVAFLFINNTSDFTNNESQVATARPESSFEEMIKSPSSGNTSGQSLNQNIMIAMSLESKFPNGELVTEVGLFNVSYETLEALWTADLGDFSLILFSDSTQNSSANLVPVLSFVGVIDSLQKMETAPLIYKNQVIDRKILRPTKQIENRVISEQPLDSSNIQELKRSRGVIMTNSAKIDNLNH